MGRSPAGFREIPEAEARRNFSALAIATQIRRILKDAGYMVRVDRRFLAERIEVGRDQIVDPRDHVEPKTFRVLQARGPEGSVGLA